MQSLKQGETPVDVVEIDSSDDEDFNVVAAKSNSNSNKSQIDAQFQIKAPKVEPGNATTPVEFNNRPLESRCFWKAGSYEIAPVKSSYSQGDLEHARVNPKFLHSNATSHKWAFGAIAELVDNAVDEISNGATFVKIDRIYNKRDNSPSLIFQDDGGGMDPDGIRKCMSLGYSTKTSNTTIGQYGNGFKTSTMRLGADVIVFSRASRSGRATQSVGLLSYTFLRRTGQDDVVVPMIDFDISDNWADPIIYSSQDDWSANLKIILDWSPFASKDDLLLQFKDMGSHGTKIIIFNLWLNEEGIYELSFDDDDEDIRLRDEANAGNLSKPNKRVLELQSHISYRLRYSLRAYASILYLRKFTNFQIILRGKPVDQFNIASDLNYSEVITYRPQVAATSKEAVVETTIGFIKEAPALGVSGFNIYHKNRLIRPFWKVTADGSSKGYGVVGVLEANFIEPAHDKQDFERSTLFYKLEAKLKQMIMEYWKGHCHLIGHKPEGSKSSKVQGNFVVRPQIPVAGMQKQMSHVKTMPVAGMQKQVSHGKTMHPARPSFGGLARLQMDSSNILLKAAQPVIDLAPEDVEEEAGTASMAKSSLDQICEENFELCRRCVEYEQKEDELRHLIEELETELKQAKMKCTSLSLHLESQRKQNLMKQL